MMKIKYCMIVIILGLALSAAGCGQVQIGGAAAQPEPTLAAPLVSDGGVVVVEGVIVPRDYTRIAARAGGEIAEVLAQKGGWVEAGTVLLRFADREQAEAALAAARLAELAAQQDLDRLNENAQTVAADARRQVAEAFSALTDARQALDDLDTDRYKTDLDNAREDVVKAEDDLDDAQDEWDRRKDLAEDNANRKNAKKKLEDAQKKLADTIRKRDRLINRMDQAQASVELAQARYDWAVLEWEKCQDGKPKPEDLALAQSQLENAQAQAAAARRALENLEIRAPFAGRIIELEVTQGEVTLPGQPLLLLADDSAWYVETTDLSELDVVKVSEGMAAEVSPDALPDLALEAAVEEIARSAGRKGGDAVYTVRLLLNETDPLLRWGMTVEVRFLK